MRLSAYVEEAVLTVAVEDSGPGFSPEALARAGRGFYTGDASRPREGHMGMGLTFAHQTARRHGGTLELSNTGRGPGRPSPCPSEEGGAVFRAAFLYFCPFRAIIEGEPIPTL